MARHASSPRTAIPVLLILLSVAFLAADTMSPPRMNEFCPVMPDEPVKASIFVEYDGRNVYLCCQRCRRQFLADPTPYLANLPPDYLASAHLAPEEPAGESDAHAHAIGERAPVAHDHSTPAHDHATGHAHGASLARRAVAFAGRFHPIAVHFPIALLFAALLAEALAWMRRNDSFVPIVRFCLFVAAAGGAVAAPLGWAAAAGSSFPGLEGTLAWHRWLGTATAILLVATVVAGEVARHRNTTRCRWIFRGLLALTALVTGIGGHMGATLVYGPDHFAFPG